METSPLCCKCEKLAQFYWPAFDRHVKPAPYCVEHYHEAKKHMVLDGPKFIPEKKGARELVKV